MSSIFAGLTPAQIAALPLDALKDLSASDIATLTIDQVAGLSAADLAALGALLKSLSAADIAALDTGSLGAATAAVIADLRPGQIAELTPNQFGALGALQLAALNKAQLADMTSADISALAPSAMVGFGAGKVAALTPAQAAGLTALQIIGMTRKERAALSAASVGALSMAVVNSLSPAALQQLSGFTPAQIAGFSPATIAKLSAAQFDQWIAPNLAALSVAKLARMTSSQLQSLSAAEVGTLTGVQIAALSIDQLNAFAGSQLADFTATQAAALSPTQIAGLSGMSIETWTVQAFDEILANRLAFVAANAVAAISIADLNSLTSAQLASFTGAQLAAMTTAQLAVIHAASSPANPILQDAVSHEIGGSLGYAGALAVLQDAAKTGMTTTTFAELTAVANALDASGGIVAPAGVRQLFDDVVLGNSANAQWNGGANAATALGDLTANSTQAQMDELIGKWFLGTDMPGLEVDPNGQSYASAYQSYTLPLYAAGAPVMTDVAQGQVGDCWFLAALAETARQDPSLIENMITSNGNGTYTVAFRSQPGGEPDFVTVNSQLPTYTDGTSQFDGSKMEFANSKTDLWAPIVEKALAQLSAQSGVTTGLEYSSLSNQYLALTAGDGEGVTLITGQSVADDSLAYLSSSGQTALLSSLQFDLTAGQDVLLGTSDLAVSNDLVSDHMFAVTSINASTGMVGLYNPWGANAAGAGVAENFSVSVSTLAAAEATFFHAIG